jgi:hypothetical protein
MPEAMVVDKLKLHLRDSALRKAEFRERASEIVAKDRDSRRFGRSVDTGGAIARALEQAYRLGVAHAAAPHAEAPQHSLSQAAPDAPVAWHTIPSRSRSIFDRIARFEWIVVLTPNADPWAAQPDRWSCYWDWGENHGRADRIELADSFSVTTLAPIVRLGLMEVRMFEGKTFLDVTAKGKATWRAAVEAGHVHRPDRLSAPQSSGP